MKVKSVLTNILIAAVLTLGLNACKKDNSTTPATTTTGNADEQTEITLATSATSSETLYDDAFDVVAQSSEQSNLSTNSTGGKQPDGISTSTIQTNYTTTNGAIITILPADPSVFPKTMTIDYGAGVTTDSITRKGQIIVALSGPIRVAGSAISVTFNSYSVNGYVLTGTYALTPSIATGGGVNYSVTVTNGSITFPGGQAATYSGTETFTQVAGIGTSTITDDTYNITGSFSFSSTTTGSITGTIVTPLSKSADCKDITSGTIAFVYKGLNGTLNFGSGTCDNIATIAVGKTTKTITLPK